MPAPEFIIRDATGQDMPELCRIRNTPKLHAKHLQEAYGRDVRFLVADAGDRLLGFATLYLANTDPDRQERLVPKLSDLHVATECRGLGIGSALIAHREKLALEVGHSRIYVGVDVDDNPRMADLLRRLGYVPMCEEPYQRTAMFEDESGKQYERTYRRTDFVKDLRSEGSMS